jgi:hypothetical protein
MKEFLDIVVLCVEQNTLQSNLLIHALKMAEIWVILDFDEIKKKYQIEDIISRDDPSLWRYLPLLPVKDPGGEGTPLRMAGELLYIPPIIKEKTGFEKFVD